MHTTGFLLATVPVVVLMPTRPIAPVLITIYVCIGTLQHANLRWTFGPAGRVLVSPAYHRLHHAADTQHVNLGVVLTIWDVLAGCARFPSRGDAGAYRAGRPARPGRAGRLGRAGPAASRRAAHRAIPGTRLIAGGSAPRRPFGATQMVTGTAWLGAAVIAARIRTCGSRGGRRARTPAPPCRRCSSP